MNPEASSSNTLNWNRDETIVVPPADRETRIAIRRYDWDRLRREVSKVVIKPSKFSQCWPTLIAIGATSGFSIPLLALPDNEGGLPWTMIVYICVCAISTLSGVVVLYFDKLEQSRRESDVQNIQTDMENIEHLFDSVDKGGK